MYTKVKVTLQIKQMHEIRNTTQIEIVSLYLKWICVTARLFLTIKQPKGQVVSAYHPNAYATHFNLSYLAEITVNTTK